MTAKHDHTLIGYQRFQEGAAAAAQDLIPGNRFRGAGPAADEAGYVRTSINHNSFVQGYLSACPEAVDLDIEGNTVAPTTGEIQVFNKGLYDPPVHDAVGVSSGHPETA